LKQAYEPLVLSGPDRNVERIGAFVAWVVSNHLLESVLEKRAGSAVARLRMQDMTGPEFLTTVLDGHLAPEHLTETGRDFAETYLRSGRFVDDFAECTYEGEHEWQRYDEISPRITRAFQAFREPVSVVRRVAKILKFPTRH